MFLFLIFMELICYLSMESEDIDKLGYYYKRIKL